MHSKTDLVVVALLSFAVGFACCDIFSHKQAKKISSKQTKEVRYELKQEPEIKHVVKDIEPKGEPKKLMDFEQMDKEFYTNLANCEPLNIKTENGYIQYIIDGVVDGKCMFKQRQIGFMDTICNLPLDVAKKYSEEGLEITRKLEELRAQNKSGFVDASKYINDITNDKTYCRHEYYQKK